MKKIIILFITVILIPFYGVSQSIENLDYVSPFNEGIAAIKKNNQWAFINQKGDIVVNYRDDLVVTKIGEDSYPIFYDGRCLIENKKDGISYFGYIDIKGETVIDAQFLNATNFNNEKAIALELVKENVGKNEALGKKVVYYKYYEVIIDANGKTLNYLTRDGMNVVLDKKFLRNPPKIQSTLISGALFSIKDENGKWSVKKLN